MFGDLHHIYFICILYTGFVFVFGRKRKNPVSVDLYDDTEENAKEKK